MNSRLAGLTLLLLVIALVTVTGCAPDANPLAEPGEGDRGPAGFLLGLWHGFILLFTFIASLFNDSVGVFEVANNGGWYNLGYLLGVSMFFGGSSKGTCKGRRRR